MSISDFHNVLISFESSMSALALSLTANAEDARDLVQDTMLTALSSDTANIEHHNVGHWLRSILHQLFTRHYNRRHTVLDLHVCEEQYHASLDNHSSVSSPQGVVAASDIEEALSNIDEESRVAFSMHLAGYKYIEIAERLGLPLGTVKSRIFSTRARLQESLKEYRQ